MARLRHNRGRALIVFVWILLIVSCEKPRDTVITGKVIKIADGDTFTLLDGMNKIRVRLYGIDCPERGQPFSNVAKRLLADKVGNKQVEVVQQEIDQYGRIVGIVFVDEVNVNELLLAEGLAWHYKEFDNNPLWAMMENDAREKRLGLWADAHPVNPRVWRKRH